VLHRQAVPQTHRFLWSMNNTAHFYTVPAPIIRSLKSLSIMFNTGEAYFSYTTCLTLIVCWIWLTSLKGFYFQMLHNVLVSYFVPCLFLLILWLFYLYCIVKCNNINPLNAGLNPIWPLLALFGAHHIIHIRR